MDQQPQRPRIRIRTLMLLIIIAGLISYIVADQWNRAREMQRLEAERERAVAEAQAIQARLQYDPEFFRKVQEAEGRPSAGALDVSSGGTGKGGAK